MPNELTLEKVQALITRAPYHQWLGLTVIAVGDDGIELKAKWREEWVVNPERRYTHGGVIATLIDIGADWAMLKQVGRPVPTIDLRIDYHRPALPRRPHRARQSDPRRRAIRHRRGANLRPGRQAHRQRPRHLLHRAAEKPVKCRPSKISAI